MITMRLVQAFQTHRNLVIKVEVDEAVLWKWQKVNIKVLDSTLNIHKSIGDLCVVQSSGFIVDAWGYNCGGNVKNLPWHLKADQSKCVSS